MEGWVLLLARVARPSSTLSSNLGQKFRLPGTWKLTPIRPLGQLSLRALLKRLLLLNEVLAEVESGVSGIVVRRVAGQAGSDEFVKIPNNKVGLMNGKGGETNKNMQASTGARIQLALECLGLLITSGMVNFLPQLAPKQIYGITTDLSL
ncbi:uncharacterized protein LOC130933133 [Arachis stenosperma]|uniref:uncharacterized protein LOC130933133 n=1 Tax=Arachis stenosperma TaxID=217475 RepID=UPI0025ACC5DB|nr:uncharacterized protein LOC130933133 [Arachis stenosperma]XP_057718648.1 uncharacterized protein LOC130933133 [Arachis stenosperma]XP_057718649.1 uncharacterized protein LOC130933133 [Arachis stenosperma]XP_057718650.1 uncharacterized protein LOC130933133 [Arachis stenosperma]